MPHDLATFFNSIDIQAIKSMVADRRQEDLHLDFKTFGSRDPKQSDTRDSLEKNLAKALSGFANSDGGILVWGVDATKDTDGINAASEILWVKGPEAVLSRLQSLTGQAVVPLVNGVLHELVWDKDRMNACIKTLIPSSDLTPHRAMFGLKQYYKRSGDSFYPLEHFDLEDMFGRRARPRLWLDVELLMFKKIADNPVCRILLTIANDGRGMAKFPLLEFSIDPPYRLNPYGLDGNTFNKFPAFLREEKRWYRFEGGINSVVHAGSRLPIAYLDYEIVIDPSNQNVPNVLRIFYRLQAAGLSSQQNAAVLQLTGEKLLLRYQPDSNSEAGC